MTEERLGYPFATFLDQHAPQLNASAVPPELWHSLYKKLSDQTFDAGDHFQIICEMSDNDEKSLFVRALEDMHNNDEDKFVTIDKARRNLSFSIFLIDHFVSFSADSARKCIESTEGLADRLAALFGIDVSSQNKKNFFTT